MILSDAEVAVLTRRTRYTAQRRALDAIGVPYRRYNCRNAAFCCAGAHLDAVRRQYNRAERCRKTSADMGTGAVVLACGNAGRFAMSNGDIGRVPPLSEPVAFIREWDGDDSDLGQWVAVCSVDERDDFPGWEPVYAAEQMRAYAAACVAAETERCCAVLWRLHEQPVEDIIDAIRGQE